MNDYKTASDFAEETIKESMDKSAVILQLQTKINKVIVILKDADNKAPTCRIIKALEVLEK